MDHILFIEKVKSEKKNEYLEYHKHAWPKLLESIKAAGIEREIIWINGDCLYLYFMAENFDKSMLKLNSSQIFKQWNRKMSPLMNEIQNYSEGQIIKLDKVFDLEEQIEISQKYNKILKQQK